MISIVDSTMRSCQSDFYEHDLKCLYELEPNTQFIWLVDKSHTCIAIINQEYWKSKLELSEYWRFDFMRCKKTPLIGLEYWMKNAEKPTFKAYHWNEKELVENVDWQYVLDFWTPIWHKLADWVHENYPEEVRYYKTHIPVYFSSPMIRSKFLESLRTSENPQELLEVARRFHKYRRCSISDKIIIGYDFAPKSFSFYQERNGQVIMNGGIIYHENTNNWQIHT